MNIIDDVKKFYDRVFGNNDGKFTAADLPNHAVLIVVGFADLVMLIAEYRVWSVGDYLTGNAMLALGFVVVSSLPFYLGQLAYRYNRANGWQQAISIGMVVMGLLVSAYYGFADYIIASGKVLTIDAEHIIPLDVDSLYIVAVVCTVIFIVSGLVYGLIDDEFANALKGQRIAGKARVVQHELSIKRGLLADLKKTREQEDELRAQYPQDYEALAAQFVKAANKQANPTNGNGTR